jgi:hypothetical protein
MQANDVRFEVMPENKVSAAAIRFHEHLDHVSVARPEIRDILTHRQGTITSSGISSEPIRCPYNARALWQYPQYNTRS